MEITQFCPLCGGGKNTQYKKGYEHCGTAEGTASDNPFPAGSEDFHDWNAGYGDRFHEEVEESKKYFVPGQVEMINTLAEKLKRAESALDMIAQVAFLSLSAKKYVMEGETIPDCEIDEYIIEAAKFGLNDETWRE